MKTTEIDWSEAPLDATDYSVDNGMWYKEENGLMYFWSGTSSKWKMASKREGYGNNPFVSRIKEVNTGLIGKITGATWDKAPMSATHVCKQNPSNFYKAGDKGWLCFWNIGESTFSSIEFSNKNSLSNGIKLLVSKEDDLQLETKPKYSSLQELPVGTFVKFNHEEDNICVWNGRTLTQMNPSMGVINCWGEDQVENYEGFRYKFNSNFDIVAYSDKYDGEYVPVTPVVPKKEQVIPEAIEQGWKIKHIKHPDYKCGRDVAVTILYREVSLTSYQYKFAICNVTDMFCRKKGVEVANGKTEVFLTRTHSSRLFNSILQDIDNNIGGSVQFKELKRYYQLNH